MLCNLGGFGLPRKLSCFGINDRAHISSCVRLRLHQHPILIDPCFCNILSTPHRPEPCPSNDRRVVISTSILEALFQSIRKACFSMRVNQVHCSSEHLRCEASCPCHRGGLFWVQDLLHHRYILIHHRRCQS